MVANWHMHMVAIPSWQSQIFYIAGTVAATQALLSCGGGTPTQMAGGRRPLLLGTVANEEYDVSRRRFPSARWQCPVAVGEMVVAGGRAPARW